MDDATRRPSHHSAWESRARSCAQKRISSVPELEFPLICRYPSLPLRSGPLRPLLPDYHHNFLSRVSYLGRISGAGQTMTLPGSAAQFHEIASRVIVVLFFNSFSTLSPFPHFFHLRRRLNSQQQTIGRTHDKFLQISICLTPALVPLPQKGSEGPRDASSFLTPDHRSRSFRFQIGLPPSLIAPL